MRTIRCCSRLAVFDDSSAPYQSRQAAYDLKQLRAKHLIQKLGTSHKDAPTPSALKLLAALSLLREKVIKPVLSSNQNENQSFA
jgi:hypothetical protein